LRRFCFRCDLCHRLWHRVSHHRRRCRLSLVLLDRDTLLLRVVFFTGSGASSAATGSATAGSASTGATTASATGLPSSSPSSRFCSVAPARLTAVVTAMINLILGLSSLIFWKQKFWGIFPSRSR
ncbi:MAG: hypothetical protein HC767_08390, partial [Akkermansiaceae bacterium]|nr:hypothetical protein [Akkermansiaceae bacterium]